MRFELHVAGRYVASARLQSALLVLGVAIGVMVYVFIAALINGLGQRLTDDVAGNVAHVTLEPAARIPRVFARSASGATLAAVIPGNDTRPQIRTWRAARAIAESIGGVRLVVPEVLDGGTVSRGEKLLPVSVVGIAAEQVSLISRIDRVLVAGRIELGTDDVILGQHLANDLGVGVGERVILQTGRGVVRSLVVRATYALGVQVLDERTLYIELGRARKLFDLADGVSQLELKLDDVAQAVAIATRLGDATGLKATNWIDKNQRLQEGIKAQRITGNMIKGFSLVTIVIGIASALLLSVARRRPEIGIMRSFGIGRRSILFIFLWQGVLVGVSGALLGALLGFGFSTVLARLSIRLDGTSSIPIDPSRGEYGRAILFAALGSVLAALLPARAAARVDPLQAIQQ